MTREPAAFFGLDVGTLDIGAQADIVLLDPEALKNWDSNDSRVLQYRELFKHKQMLNRSDGVVNTVLINGEPVWQDGQAPVRWARSDWDGHCAPRDIRAINSEQRAS